MKIDLIFPGPHGLKITWALVKPKQYTTNVQKIAIDSVYISPSSVYKTKTIDHIIETIHFFEIAAWLRNKIIDGRRSKQNQC